MERYQPIIDDWDAFTAACDTEPVPAIRRNPLKAPDDFADRIREQFPGAEQVGWNDNVWRLPDVEKPGASLLHWRGEYYVQEASATLPVTVLNPQPGETVLDMCAAPGGKTTQLAGLMRNTGVVVANEKRGRRMKSLHANVNRTGSACVTTRHGDGRTVQGTYDRVLVDAPCSGEGNECRRTFEPATEEERTSLAELQIQLMEQAATVVKEGGVVVYSTCTFAPVENEAVVDHVLAETELSIEKVTVPVPHQRGIVSFADKQFSRDVRNTVRVYPHHLTSGGMYIARFRR